jgi:hypothetical protein
VRGAVGGCECAPRESDCPKPETCSATLLMRVDGRMINRQRVTRRARTTPAIAPYHTTHARQLALCHPELFGVWPRILQRRLGSRGLRVVTECVAGVGGVTSVDVRCARQRVVCMLSHPAHRQA